MKITDVVVNYHRNGVSGIGFHIVLFSWRDTDAQRTRRMMATVFPERGHLAVLDVEETVRENIAFAQGNSWYGDNFEAVLREEITHYQGA